MSIHDSDTVEDIRSAFAVGRVFVHPAVDLASDIGVASLKGFGRSENHDH